MGWQADMADLADHARRPPQRRTRRRWSRHPVGRFPRADTIPDGIMTSVIISNVMITEGIITHVGKGAEAAPRANPQNVKMAELLTQ